MRKPKVMGQFRRTLGALNLFLLRLAQNTSAHRCLHTLFPAALIASFWLCAPQIFALWVPDTLPELLFRTTPSFFSKPSSHSMPIAPAPSRTLSPIHF